MNNGQAKTQGIYPISLRDIVGIWQMDEAGPYRNIAGEVVDSSGNANHGSAIDGVKSVPRKNGIAKKFTSSNSEYLGIPHSSSLNIGGVGDDYAISYWIKKRPMSAVRDFFAKRFNSGSYPFSFTGNINGTIAFKVWDGTVVASSGNTTVTIDDFKWHHVVGVRDTVKDKVYCYIDGNLDVSNTDTTTVSAANSDVISLFRDKISGGGPFYIDGQIDQIMIWNRSLSASEIKVLYNHQLSQ